MSARVEIILQGTDNASGPIGNVKRSLGELQGSGGGATSALGGIARGALGVATGMLGVQVGVAGARAAMENTVGAAATFESGMNVLRATSQATTDQMALLQQKAIDLGGDLTLPATSASDAGEAMLELSKAGLSVNEILASSMAR
jgi:hypothetical protein